MVTISNSIDHYVHLQTSCQQHLWKASHVGYAPRASTGSIAFDILMIREEDRARTFIMILGVLVLLAVGATIYLGPAQVLEMAGGLIPAGDAVDAGSGSEAAAPQASPDK